MPRRTLTWFFIALILLGGLLIALAMRTPAAPETGDDLARVANTPVPSVTLDPFLLPFPTKTAVPTATPTPVNATQTPPSTRRQPSSTPTITPTPTPTPSPSPTPTATGTATATTTAIPDPPTPIPNDPLPPVASNPIVPGFLERFGAIGGNRYLQPAVAAGLPVGTFMNWRVDPTQPLQYGTRFWHMIRLGPWDGMRSSWADVDRVLAEQPGAVWIIGNEPDVLVQDSLTPQTYARLYHDLYLYIKSADPDALVAIAGVAQPTPLRRAYLDEVLAAYQRDYGTMMPIDIWTVHNFILREEANSWGVGIPPGMNSSGAKLYEISDHDRLDIFQQNLREFRAWMAARGYGDRPLAVTEYGIVMPHDYGFPPEDVAAFLTATFDYFLTAAGSDGYAPDGGRLVQWWAWFSLYEAQEGFSTGNLYDPDTEQLTPLGQTWANYVNNR